MACGEATRYVCLAHGRRGTALHGTCAACKASGGAHASGPAILLPAQRLSAAALHPRQGLPAQHCRPLDQPLRRQGPALLAGVCRRGGRHACHRGAAGKHSHGHSDGPARPQAPSHCQPPSLSPPAPCFAPAVPVIFLHEPRGRKRVKPEPLTIVEEPYVEAATFQATATGIEPVDPVGRRAVATLFLKLLIPDLLFTTGEGAVIALLQVFFVARYFLRTDTLGVLFTLAGLSR